MANTVLAIRPPPSVDLLRRLRGLRRRHFVLGISVFLLLLVAGTGLLAPLLAPHNPHRGNLADQKLPPPGLESAPPPRLWSNFPNRG